MALAAIRWASHDVMFETLGDVCQALPDNRPRYFDGRRQPHDARARGARAWTCSTACSLRARPAWAPRFLTQAA